MNLINILSCLKALQGPYGWCQLYWHFTGWY